MLKDKENKVLYTPTMAKVLENQGYLKEAMEIYSHLLEQMPGHTAFREKVAEIECRLAEKSPSGDQLPALFDEWLTLVLSCRRLKELKKLSSEKKGEFDETDI